MAFDGAIYEARHLSEVISVRGEREEAAKTLGLRVAVKQRGSVDHISGESGISATWGGILASGAAHLSEPLVKLSGSSMCLYNAVRFLRSQSYAIFRRLKARSAYRITVKMYSDILSPSTRISLRRT